jgi:TP901 family phage tail tape measure protein
MADKQVNADVGVNITPKGMQGALDGVNAKLDEFISKIRTAGAASDQQLKTLAIQAKRLQSLQGAAGTSFFGSTSRGAETLGERARAFQGLQRSIDASANSMGILRDRVRSANKEIGTMIQEGRKPGSVAYLNAENLERSAKAYTKVTNEVGQLRGRIALMGNEGRQAFAPMLASLEELDRKNAKIFANPSATNFEGATAQMQRQVKSLREQVGIRERLEAKSRLNIQALREEGLQIATNTRLEREALAARMVRQGETNLKNRELIGVEGPYRRLTDLTTRLANQTNYLNTAKKQLNAELSKPVEQQNAARLQQLINRHNVLQREIGETIALRHREEREAAKSVGKQGGFFGGLKTAPGNLLSEEGGGSFGAGQLVGRVAAYAVAASAIYGLMSSMRQGIAFAIDFEDALAQLKAVSGSTSYEMERLSQGILDVSKNSANSVMELTKSATIIAQAGYAGNEIQNLLQNVVNLSAAAGSTTDESVDILTSALGSFQLAASEATQVTDALVAALNDSKLSVNQVQLGLQYVGATARLNNITFNELVATLGAMADAGIRSGSTMSTGLRQMLVDFLDPSEKLIAQLEKVGLTTADIDVKVLGLTEVLSRLRDSGFQAYGSLETRAAAAYAVLSSNVDQIDKLEQATLRQNVAQEAAAERIDSVSARWQRMLNVLGEIMAAIGENLTPLIKLLIDTLGLLATMVLGVVRVFTQLFQVFGLLYPEADKAKVSLDEMNAALQAQGLTAEEAAAYVRENVDANADLESALKDTGAEMDSLKTHQQTLSSETEKLIMRKKELGETTGAAEHQLGILSARFPELRAEFKKTEGGIDGLIQAMIRLDMKTRETMARTSGAIAAQQGLMMQEQVAERDRLRKEFQLKPRHGGGRSGSIRPLMAGEERLERLVRTGSMNDVLDLLNANPKLASAYPELTNNVAGMVSKYYASRSQREQAIQQQEQYRYSVGPQGRLVVEGMSQDSAAASYAASQGQTQDGRSVDKLRQDLQNRVAQLNQYAQEAESAGNEGALALIGQALASTNAAIAQIAPDPEKKKKGDNKAARAAQKRERDNARIEARIAKEEVEYRKELYENTLDSFKNAPDLSELPETLDMLDDQLNAWLDSEAEMAVQDIERLTPNAQQRGRLMEVASRKAEQLRLEQINKIADQLGQVIENFIETTVENIEDAFTKATRPSERAVAIAQARVSGLNNPVGNQNTPEYLRTVMQRRADEAQDVNNRATIIANDTRIEQYIELVRKAREEKDQIENQLQSMLVRQENTADNASMIVVTGQIEEQRVALRDVKTEIENIEQETENLTDSNVALKASYDVLNEVPTTFGEGMRLALEAVKYDIGAADSLGQELINNLDQPLRAVHESFKGFFSDVIGGTVSLSEAFANMASRIIDSILEMVAVALANQFFSMIAGMFAPGVSGMTSEFSPSGGMSNWISNGGAWNGGQVGSNQVPIRRFSGGEINSGLPTRDSTLLHAAKGEYVVRRGAASSLGKGFLDAINARGANALKGMGQNTLIAPQGASEPVNVYVVSPDQKPTLGPKEVLVVIQDDMLQGGVTKKLVKSIARGET